MKRRIDTGIKLYSGKGNEKKKTRKEKPRARNWQKEERMSREVQKTYECGRTKLNSGKER